MEVTRILLVEDVAEDEFLILDVLRRSGIGLDGYRRVSNREDLAEALAEGNWDVVLSDYHLPEPTAIDTLDFIQAHAAGTPVLIVSGVIGEEQAVEAMRHGASDYLMKDRMARLPAAIRNAAREAKLRTVQQQNLAEIKRLNQELLTKVEALRRSNGNLEHFARAASHDLKEPLRAITNYTNILLRRFASVADPQAQEFAGYIREAVERMRSLIDGLLVYSRATDQLEPGRTNICALIADVVREYEYALRQLDGRIAVKAPGPRETVPDVAVHPAAMRQVLTNLVGNALKYSRPGIPPRVEIKADFEPDRVWISVSDNGMGIAPAHREQIFDPFRRLHGSEVPGLGVGLAICKRLVERSGGTIRVDSELDSGTTFHVELPLVAPSQMSLAGFSSA